MTDLTWSLSSCVLIGAVIAVRAAFGARMRPALRYALWGLVLLRLLIPVQLFTAPWGVSVELPERVAEQEISVLPTAQEPTLIPGEVETFEPVPETEPPVQAAEPVEPAERIEPAEAPAPKPVDDASSGYGKAVPDGAEAVRRTVSAAELLRAVWLAGAGVTAAVFFASNLRFYVRLRRRRRPLETDCPLRVYSVENISSSCLFGNAIYVEAETAPDESRLRHVLAHELSHYRHGDRVWALLRCVALSLHWYNPLVWLAASLSRQDSELCADAGALRYLGENAREHYGATLIELSVRRAPRASLLCAATTMSSGKRSLRERVTMIARRPRMTAAVVIAVLALTTVAAGCVFAGAQAEADSVAEDSRCDVLVSQISDDLEQEIADGFSVQAEDSVYEAVPADLPDEIEAAEEDPDAAAAEEPVDPTLDTDTAEEPDEKELPDQGDGGSTGQEIPDHAQDAVLPDEESTQAEEPATKTETAVKPYLTFRSDAPFTLATGNYARNWDGVLEYSTDTQTWREWNGTTLKSGEDSHALYLRGTGNTVITDGMWWMLNGSKIACSGNIENLLDYQLVAAGKHPSMTRNCFAGMFKDCKALTTSPELPATVLSTSCYIGMFFNCTALTVAPTLPAMSLASHCYSEMFFGCTALTKAPKLPATTLASDCYFNMFRGCTALTAAPELPAMSLTVRCYEGMFQDCTALVSAPELPATTLEGGCYAEMFQGCTALKKAPKLPATTTGAGCYSGMFRGCTALTTLPALPVTMWASCYNFCYYHMFDGCSSIKLSEVQTEEYTIPYRIPIPVAEAGMVHYEVLTDMFAGTGGTFTGTPDVNTTYYLHSSNSIVG